VSSGELRSTAELATWIAMAHKTVTRRVVKVLVLGNSGAGKSFLVNVVLGANTFAHRGQLASVTDATTYAGLTVPD
jgi:predicted GTPase